MFRFASPWLLSLLPLSLAAGWWLMRRRTRIDPHLRLPAAALRVRLRPTVWTRLERFMPLLRVAILSLLVLALARPQSGSRIESVSTEGVDIVVALDRSTSMLAEDFKPDNRLEVAKRTVETFVAGRPHDRIGLIVFAGLAVTRCPLTVDHDLLRSFVQQVDIAEPEEDGTAIGMGLATAINRLRNSSAKSKVVVLVTDGRNNAGQVGPEAAAEAARALGIRVYTVGVGTEGPAPFPVRTMFGVQYDYRAVDLDEALLEQIAEQTGARYFRATDADGLRETFATIDELETTELESRVRMLYTELFPSFLVPALVLLGLERLASITRLRRLP